MLQAELDKEKTNCQSLKKKYEETCETLETVKYVEIFNFDPVS
jgi:hypothetical protein